MTTILSLFRPAHQLGLGWYAEQCLAGESPEFVVAAALARMSRGA